MSCLRHTEPYPLANSLEGTLYHCVFFFSNLTFALFLHAFVNIMSSNFLCLNKSRGHHFPERRVV